MRKITLALSSLIFLGLTAPVIQSAQAQDVTVIKRSEPRKKVVIRHDRGRHVGFSHSRHYGYGKSVTVVKKKPGKKVIKRYES
jgi:hypothetical protein